MDFSKNPLDELSDLQFKEFLIAKENDFVKITEMGKVIVDYGKFYDIYHKLQWHSYFNHKEICDERNVSLLKTIEIMDLLIYEKLSQIL